MVLPGVAPVEPKGVVIRLENNERIKSKIYTFLAEAYKSELTEERIVELVHILEQIQTDVPEFIPVLNELKEYLVRIKADAENALLPLGIEYMNIFRGAGDKSVFLYEAVHRSEEGLMYEAPYFEVKAFYDKLGFEVEPDWIEPEDHISVECNFLAFLSDSIAQGRAEGDIDKQTFVEEQRNAFLREHFLKWVPQFSTQVVQHTSQAFYKQLGMLTAAICEQISSAM